MDKKMSTLFALVLLIACVAPKKTPYDFPAAMADNIKAQYLVQCDKGKFLYDKNCARCHNTTVKGKVIVPDFSEEKLVGYALRNANKKHESAMPDTLVSAEELGLIMTYLSYKRKKK